MNRTSAMKSGFDRLGPVWDVASRRPAVTLVTPSHAGHYDWFAFQRESMARCRIDLPHIVIVDEADARLFAGVPHREGLTVLTVDEVLAPGCGRWYRRARRSGRLPGWWLQQLLKLGAHRFVATPGYVCVDSEVFWLRNITSDAFHDDDGKLLLCEYDFTTPQITQWTRNGFALLGLSPPIGPQPAYVYETIPLHRDVVRDLLSLVEARTGRWWGRALIEHQTVEYVAYGIYARHVDRLQRVTPTSRSWCMGYWTLEEASRLGELLPEVVANGGYACMVQSTLGLSPSTARPLVEPVWGSPVLDAVDGAGGAPAGGGVAADVVHG